jgi:predicted transcriptional regulator of viral defense system
MKRNCSKGGDAMSEHTEMIKTMLAENGGYITNAQIDSAGIPRRVLGELVKAEKLYRAERGIYALPEAWEDEMYFLQYRFSRGIFSLETALYLHKMSDRTPHSFTMTFPRGYNAKGAKEKNVSAKFVVPEIYELGVTTLPSPCGNTLRVYDIERTLCDTVKGSGCDVQLVNSAMKQYAASGKRDMAKLLDFAEQLRVKSKILTYMEVLL